MTMETLTVRMNRSSASIPWGLTLTYSGANIVANSIEKDSLADKAGIRPNDNLTELSGYFSPSLTLNKARELLMQPSQEVTLTLNRRIMTHPTLPWTLTEKENKITVDEVHAAKYAEPPRAITGYSQPQGALSSASRGESLSSSRQVESKLSRPVALGYEPAPFRTPTSTSAYEEKIFRKKEGFQNDYNTSSYTKKETYGGDTSAYKPAPFTTNTSTVNSANKLPIFTSGGSQTSNVAQRIQTFAPNATVRSVPINATKNYTAVFPGRARQTTTYNQERSQPKGFATPFHHSPRTRRYLSPSASVRHLQINPINVSYAAETPAEEYLRKTGGLFGTDPNLFKHAPSPYLNSETRRMIAEEEGELGRSTSPTVQSSSFKRISRAVGTPII